jgi:flavin-dependent dehydrogenase
MPATLETDIAILGAGVAGCTAAIALAPGYRVVLVDRQADPPPRIGECLPPAAGRILKQLGLSAHFDTEQANAPHRRAMGMRSFWGSDQVRVTDHLRNPDGFGWHLDRPAFERFLRQSAAEAGATCLWPAPFRSATDHQTHWQLKVGEQADHDIKATYVIDATGRKAPFAKKQGAKRRHLDRLVACWGTVPNQSPQAMGLISAAESGWWYSAPLPNGRRVLSYQTDSDLITSELHRQPAAFLQLAMADNAIAQHLSTGDPQLALQGIVPANSSRLDRVAGRNWAALGDAATGFDPLSSQGMFHAMATAMQLSGLIRQSQTIEGVETGQWIQQQYSHQIDRIWAHYLNHRQLYYTQEAQRRQSEFWQRRMSGKIQD